MVVVAEVRVKSTLTRDWTQRVKDKYKAAMNDWGKVLERDVKDSARKAGIEPFTGRLYGQGIRYIGARTRDFGQLVADQHVVYVDSMRPHTVPITKNSVMLRWALRAKSDAVRRRALRVLRSRNPSAVEFVYVRPHPFISEGMKVARKKLPALLRRAASKKVGAR